MKPGLKPGDRASFSMRVTAGDTVPALFADRRAFLDMPDVFATAKMVGLMEWACVEQLRPYYEDGEDSLGIHVDVDHSAPTLPGQVVTVETEVEEIDGRFLWFRVVAHDGIERAEIIGLISLMIWTLTIIVSLKYVVLVLRADNKGEGGTLKAVVELPASLSAPVAAGEQVGRIKILHQGTEMCSYPITAAQNVDALSFRYCLLLLAQSLLLRN